jgi:hypothetical protein
MIALLALRTEQSANLVWNLIRRLSALCLKKVLGRVALKCMMCAIASGVVAECETTKQHVQTDRQLQ